MSILDVFTFIFESDASKLKAGTDEAKKSADDVTKAMFDADHAASALGEGLKEVAIEAAAAIGALFAIDHVMDMVREQAEFADKLGKTAQMLEVNVSDLHAWGEAAARSGGSVEAFTESLKGVQAGLAMVATTGHSRAAPFFEELGIAMTDASGKARNVMDLLPEIASKIEGMGHAESTGLLRKMGFDDGTIILLQQGKKAVDELVARQKALGVVTKEDAEIAEKFNDQLDDVRQMLNRIYLTIGTLILPGFTWMLQKFEAVYMAIREHSDTFAVLGKGLLIVAGIITAVYLPAIASAAVATIAATWPFLLIAAAVAALFLAFDDLITYLNGGKSIIGDFISQFPLLENSLRAAIGVVQYAADMIVLLMQAIWDAITLGPAKAFDLAGERGEEMAKRLREAFAGMKENIAAVADFLTEKWQGFLDLLKKIPDLISGLLSKAGNFLGALGIGAAITAAPAAALPPDVQSGLAAGQSAIAETNTPLSSLTGTSLAAGNTSNSSNTVQIGKIEVNTQATDAQGISQGIGDGLDQHLRHALDQNSDGVAG